MNRDKPRRVSTKVWDVDNAETRCGKSLHPNYLIKTIFFVSV